MADTQNYGGEQNATYFPPEYFEKRDIKRDALHIGATLLVLLFIMFFWSYPVVIIALISGVSQEKLFAALEDPMVMQIIQTVMSFIMIFLPFFVLGKKKSRRLTDIISFKPPKKSLTLPFISAGVAFCLFVSIVTGIAGSIFEGFGISIPNPEQELPEGVYGIIAMVVSTVLTPAFVEEFAMRGVVLGILRKYGDTFAVFASALIFGVMHANIYQIPFAFILGLFFAVIVIKTDSIWPAILLHGINNGISVAFSYLEKYTAAETADLVYLLFLCAVMVVSIIGIAVLMKRDADALKIGGSRTVSESKQQIKWFTLSPTIIISVITAVLFGFALR